MIRNVSFKESELTIVSSKLGNKNINVHATIIETVFTDQYVIIRLRGKDLANSEYHNRNILCFKENGSVMWRIANQDKMSPSKEKTNYFYSSLELKNGDVVKVGTTLGMEVDVNIRTGEFVSDWTFTK